MSNKKMLSGEKKGFELISLHSALHVLRLKFRVLLTVAVVAALIAAAFFYFVSNNSAAAVMSLNYEQSTKGLLPNSTRFSVSEMRSEAVALKALEYAGLEDSVTPQELIDCIDITQYSAKPVDIGDAYIATSFRITYTAKGKLKEARAEDMLELIIKAYKDLFYGKYINNTDAFDSAPAEPYTEMEFYQIADDFKLRLEKIDCYLEMRINENNAFTSETTGQSFKQLREMCNNIKSVSYANYRSYVWEHGVVRDPALSGQILEYRNFRLQDKYNHAMDEYSIRKQVIDAYQNSMTDSVLIPSYDSNGEFYMARTKIGIDKLALEAEGYLERAKDISTEIDSNKDMLAKIKPERVAEEVAKAEQIASTVDRQITSLEETIKATDEEYKNKITRNYLSFLYITQSFIQKIHIKRVIPLAGVIVAALYVVFYVKYCIRQKKEIERA